MAKGEEIVGQMVGWMVGLWQQTYHALAPVNKGLPKDHGRLLGHSTKRWRQANERASAFARGVLKEVEALAGTTACKSVQLVRLRQRPSRPWRLYGRHHLVQRLGYRLQDT